MVGVVFEVVVEVVAPTIKKRRGGGGAVVGWVRCAEVRCVPSFVCGRATRGILYVLQCDRRQCNAGSREEQQEGGAVCMIHLDHGDSRVVPITPRSERAATVKTTTVNEYAHRKGLHARLSTR